MATQEAVAEGVLGVVECMVECIEAFHLYLPTSTSDEIAVTLHALCVAVSVSSPASSLLDVYAMTATLVHNFIPWRALSCAPQLQTLAGQDDNDYSYEIQEMHRLVQSCVQYTHRHRLTRGCNLIHEQYKNPWPHTELAQVAEDPVEDRWTPEGELVYARKNVFNNAFAPLHDCRRYARHRLPDAAIYKALRTIVRQNIVAREVNRIAQLNQPKPDTHPDNDDVNEVDNEGTAVVFASASQEGLYDV
ncbi:hypothetical protein H310_05010 [Aphanomyces invadans]|uniref:Uncharacterized protein n=1 Tax=Aphanomyces invadans TaxID=157072 RepID=A0A024UB09_9STRA|nr:hypothetical protein H310_05010 [Aphanomyces invadans]ETW03606.1 hypothetical protein H310_05010 [Aphanomyces invadans]|eukprot:XP_008867835.1 hypothetical protein H310_05010 [Aphanomyces invadans]